MQDNVTKLEAIQYVREFYSIDREIEPRYAVLDKDKSGEEWWRITFAIEANDRLSPKYDYLIAEVHTVTGEIVPELLL